MNIKLISVVIMLSFVLPVYSAFLPDGGVVSPVLSYSVGARAYAMGRAYTALADDTTAVFWNPAGLAQVHRQEVSSFFETLFSGTTYFFLGYTYPVWNVGVFSGSIMYLGTGDIPGRASTVDGDLGSDLGSYSAYEMCINLSFAQKLQRYQKVIPFFKYLDAGANLKLFGTGLQDTGKIGIGFDLGVKYFPTHFEVPRLAFIKNIVVGLKLNNVVPPTVKLSDERDWYMMDLNFGLLYRTIYDTLNITVDFTQTIFKKSRIKPRVGLEYTFYKIFKVRVGYNTELSTGIGVKLEDLTFDYAFGHNFDLGALHHISATYQFGEIIP